MGCCCFENQDAGQPVRRFAALQETEGDNDRWPSSASTSGNPAVQMPLPRASHLDRASSGAGQARADLGQPRVPCSVGWVAMQNPPRGASRRGQCAALASQQVQRTLWKHVAEDTEDNCCAICSESLDPRDTTWKLPCGHCVWHEACVHQWLSKHGSCPLCRMPVDIPRAPVETECADDCDAKKQVRNKIEC
jgi:E3 ubiquitin-protein ligase RNF115/126